MQEEEEGNCEENIDTGQRDQPQAARSGQAPWTHCGERSTGSIDVVKV